MQKKQKKKNYFDSDQDVISDQQSPEKGQALKVGKPYEENFQRYMKFFKQYIVRCEAAQSELFQNGVRYVNHPLIEFTQINYEKNFGIFDIIPIREGSDQFYQRTAVLFTYLDNEVNKIRELLQCSLFDNLIMYGDRAQGVDIIDGEAEVQTARIIGVYKKVYDIIRKLMSYVEHTILQIHCIRNKKEVTYKSIFKGLPLYYPIQVIGKALRIIYLIDTIVNNNDFIIDHWNLYKKLVKLMRADPQKFGTTAQKAKNMEKLVIRLQKTLLSGRVFQTVISMEFDKPFEKSDVGLFKNNKQMRQFLEDYFEDTIKKLTPIIGSPAQKQQRTRLLEMMCVYALYRKMYPSQELRDTWKTIWNLQKVIPIIEGYSSVNIYIAQFLNSECPLSKPSTTRDPKDPKSYLKQYIQKFDQTIPSEINSIYTQLCIWFSRMHSVVTSNYSLNDVQKSRDSNKVNDIIRQRVSNRISLMVTGISLLAQMRRAIYTSMMLHINEEIGISKSIIGNLILGLQSMKAIEHLFYEKAEAFQTTLMSKQVCKDLDRLIRPAYEKLDRQQKGKKKMQRQQPLSAFKKILQIINTPISQLKLAIIRYSISFLSKGFFKDEELVQIRKAVDRLQLANQYPIILERYSNCSFLYSCKEILATFFQWKRNNPNSCKRMQFMFNSFEDSSNMIQRCVHLENPAEVFLDYKKFILNQFQKYYMLPLKRQIQDFLRINIHFMLIEKIQGQNPFKTEIKDLMKLVHFEKIRIFDSIIDIKSQITKSFNQTFYNMNVINMYDMETYEQIRTMGNYLFGLELQNVYLPSQTIDQGQFDILYILRNIPQFVQKYKYNIYTQSFLELTGDAKQISSISIRQLSDSIKTHGLGILSTTVNAFYKFLSKKIQSFSKFLFDDYIQSPLLRQRNWLREASQKEDFQGYYPYQRAEALYKEIKKLGKLQDDKNFLDKFRILITSVGNILGFVRLLRSASLNFSSKSIEFLPKKIEFEERFSEIAKKTSLSQPSIEACGQLDDIFNSLQNTFSDRVDYLKKLVKGFSKLASKQNKHLNVFCLIIPALSLNYVDNVLIGKEQINKKLSKDAFINDDGFVLGVSYFLALLKQNHHYQALHWDRAISVRFQRQIQYSQNIAERADRSKRVNEDLNMQKQLNLRKLNMQRDQFQMFTYTITASKILFRQQEQPVQPPPQLQQVQSEMPPPPAISNQLPPPPPPL